MNTHRYHVTRKTSNAKLGKKMACTTSSMSTCPDTCPLKNGGCYASAGFHLRQHWTKVSDGTRGVDTAEQHAAEIRSAVADGRMIRLNQAGDLPTTPDGKIDRTASAIIADATAKSAAAWTYTHNLDHDAADHLNTTTPLTVNVSTNDHDGADAAMARGGSPVVTLLADADSPSTTTAAGNLIVTCPAQRQEGLTCDSCGNGRPLCSRKDRSFAVGFSVHGAKKNAALKVLQADRS